MRLLLLLVLVLVLAVSAAAAESVAQTPSELSEEGKRLLSTDPGKALKSFEALVSLEPDNEDAWFQIGLIHHNAAMESGNHRNMRWANQAFNALLKLRPDHDSARYLLAQNLVSLGDLFEGDRQLKMFLKQCKAVFERLSKPDSGASSEQMEEATANLIDGMYAAGTIASKQGDSKRAQSFYRRVLKLSPQHSAALLALSSELQLSGNEADDLMAEKLIKALRKVIRGLSEVAINTLQNFFSVASQRQDLRSPVANLAPQFQSSYKGRRLRVGDEIEQHALPSDGKSWEDAQQKLAAWRRSRTPGVLTASPAGDDSDPLAEHFGWTVQRWLAPGGERYLAKAAGNTVIRVQQRARRTGLDLFDYRAVTRHSTVLEYQRAISSGGEEACALLPGLQPVSQQPSKSQPYLRPPLVDLERDIPAPKLLGKEQVIAAYLSFGNCTVGRQIAALRHDNSDRLLVQVAGEETTVTLLSPDQAQVVLPTFGKLGGITDSGLMMYQRSQLPELFSFAGHFTQLPAPIRVPEFAGQSSGTSIVAERLELELGGTPTPDTCSQDNQEESGAEASCDSTERPFELFQQGAVGVHIRMQPGDVLFVPAGWYHQELSRGLHATIAYWMSTAAEIPEA